MIRAELNQTILRGGQRLPRRELRRALSAVSRALNIRRDVGISVAFIGEGDMRRLNRTYRGRDKVTDVLSFRLDGDSFGEVLICYPQARRQAEAMGHSVRREAVFLLVHGVLHLFGWDHETARDAGRMFPMQAKILRTLGIEPRI